MMLRVTISGTDRATLTLRTRDGGSGERPPITYFVTWICRRAKRVKGRSLRRHCFLNFSFSVVPPSPSVPQKRAGFFARGPFILTRETLASCTDSGRWRSESTAYIGFPSFEGLHVGVISFPRSVIRAFCGFVSLPHMLHGFRRLLFGIIPETARVAPPVGFILHTE